MNAVTVISEIPRALGSLAGQVVRNAESIEISKEKNETLINFFETLEDDDDVQNIYTNVKFTK